MKTIHETPQINSFFRPLYLWYYAPTRERMPHTMSGGEFGGAGGFGLFYLISGVSVLALELIAGRHRGIYSRSEWLINLLCGAIGMAVVRPLLSIIGALIFMAIAPGHKDMLAGAPLWLAFAVGLLVTEFLFYWAHRWAHEGKGKRGMDWLWQLHRTHHSAGYMNIILLIRQHPLWPIVQPQTWTVGFLLYAGQPVAAALIGVATYGWNLITHSNFRWDDRVRAMPVIGRAFRAAEHVVISPGIHHTHHGYGKDGANYRNFGLIFSIFDTLFGTLHIPDGRPWRYGLPGADAPWQEQVFYPLVRPGKKR